MQFYATPADETAALRRAVARVGCRVRALATKPRPNGEPAQVLGVVDCGDGWAAARLLLALAIEDSETPGARDLAAQLRARAPSDRAFARELQRFVRERVKFAPEVGEIFQSGAYTLRTGIGDCDDHFRLLFALARAGGLPAALGTTHHGDDAPPALRGPTHAAPVLGAVPGAWEWAETTIDAHYGEHPFEAGVRLGKVSARADLAKEVRIMTENDLPPVPAGFADRNPAARVLRDAEALRALGYLRVCARGAWMSDPTSPVLRRAVAEFQRDQRLKVDGLLGDKETRPALARAMAAAGLGDAYPAAPPTIGAVAPVHSARISDAFLRDVARMVSRFKAKGATTTGRDFLAVWLAESGLKNIQNHAGAPAYGINQLWASEEPRGSGKRPGFRAVGFEGTPEQYLALSLVDQLPYVERYYVNATGGNLKLLRDVSSLYLVNFTPAYVAHANDPTFRIAERNGKNAGIYRENAVIDVEGKGWIEVGDLAQFVAIPQHARDVKPFWEEVTARYEAIAPGDVAPPDGSGIVGAVAVVGLLVAGGWAAWHFAVTS